MFVAFCKGSRIDHRVHNKVLEFLADELHDLRFDPGEPPVHREANEGTGENDPRDIDMGIFIAHGEQDEPAQTVPIQKQREVGIGLLNQADDIPLQIFYLTTASGSPTIPESPHIHQQRLVVQTDEVLGDVPEPTRVLAESVDDADRGDWGLFGGEAGCVQAEMGALALDERFGEGVRVVRELAQELAVQVASVG